MIRLRNLSRLTHGLLRLPLNPPLLNHKYCVTKYNVANFSNSINSPSQTIETSSPASMENDLANKIKVGLQAYWKNDYNTSTTFLEEALKLFNETQNKSKLSEVDYSLVLQAYYQLGKIYEKHQDIQEASNKYLEALKVAEAANIKNTPEVANINNSLGRIRLKQSEMEEAKAFLERARDIFMSIGNSMPGIVGQVIENAYMMAVVYGDHGQLDKALELLEDILKNVENQGGNYKGELDIGLVYVSGGNMYLSKNDLQKATEYWNRGLDIVIQRYGDNSPNVLTFYYTIAQSLIQRQKYKEAEPYVDKNLAICQQIYDETNPKIAEALFMCGLTQFQTEELDKALESYEKGANIFASYPEQYHDQVSFAYLTMAEIYLVKKQVEEAREAFDKSLQIVMKALGPDHPKVGDYYSFWGELLRHKADNKKGARLFYRLALDTYMKYSQAEGMEARIIHLYYDIGSLLLHEGNVNEAMRHFQECLQRCDKADFKPKFLEDMYNYMGSIFFQQQKYKESAESFQQAVDLCLESGDPKKDVDVYYRNLGLAYEYRGSPEQAVIYYQKALDIAVKNRGKDKEITKSHLNQIISTLNQLGRKMEAKKIQEGFKA